jgi:IS30 family transposase
MEAAKERKSTAIDFISRHLVSTARQAIVKISQTQIARTLNKPDSTIMRRTERLEDDMDILAAAGVEDFVMKGEKKITVEQYRYLMTVAIEFAKYQLEVTEDNSLAA